MSKRYGRVRSRKDFSWSLLASMFEYSVPRIQSSQLELIEQKAESRRRQINGSKFAEEHPSAVRCLPGVQVGEL